MSRETSTTEATEGAEDQTTVQKPAGNFDDKGRFTPAKGAKYAASTQTLITRYNELIDNLALFREPAVAKHLLHAADISDKPAAIQNLADGLRKLLDAALEESKKNGQESADATLTALRTQLTEEFDQKLADLKQGHQDALSAKDLQIEGLGDQLGMYQRLSVYQDDLHGTLNGFVRLFGGPESLRVGFHPVGTDSFSGDSIRRRFETADFQFTVVTMPPNTLGDLTDYVTIGSTRKTKLPKLVTTQLELRTNPDIPGLSDNGHQTLETVLRRMTHNWFNEVATRLTDDELGKTFQDPAAARNYFRDTGDDEEGFNLLNLIGLSQGHEHNGEGPGSCPACNASLSAMLYGFGDAEEFDYTSTGPFGTRLIYGRGLGNWGGSRSRRRRGTSGEGR